MYFSPNIVLVIKSRRMRLVGHIACIWEIRAVYRVLVGKPEGKSQIWRPRFRWRIILRWIIYYVQTSAQISTINYFDMLRC